MAILIKANKETRDVEPSNGKTFSLKELQGYVGGYIELIHIVSGDYKDHIMVVDEEGLLKQNPVVNATASLIAVRRIVGDVLIVKRTEIE